jgi:hypothetical protein
LQHPRFDGLHAFLACIGDTKPKIHISTHQQLFFLLLTSTFTNFAAGGYSMTAFFSSDKITLFSIESLKKHI